MSDVWGDVVKDGKRGPRGHQRKGFINVVRKEKGVSTNDPIGFQFVEMEWTNPHKIAVDLFFTKNQNRNNWHCKTSYVTSTVHTLIDHSSKPISA